MRIILIKIILRILKIIEPVLKRIFPNFGKILDTSALNYGHGVNNFELIKQQRIASPDFFDRIFSLNVPKDQISNFEIKMLLGLQDNADAFYQKLQTYNYQQKCELINFLDIHESEIEKNNIFCIAQALSLDAENIEEENQVFSVPLSRQIGFFIDNIIEKHYISTKERIEAYKELANINIGAYFTNYLLFGLSKMIGLYNSSEDILSYEKLDENPNKDDFQHIENILIRRIKKLAENGNLIAHTKASMLLYSWERFNAQEAKDFIAEFIKTDDGLASFLACLTGYVSTSSKSTAIIRKNTIEDFTSEEELIPRARAIKDSDRFSELPNKSQEAITALLNRD